MFAQRPLTNEDDYWRIRTFLRQVYLLNDRRERSWQVARLDYWRYFGNDCLEHYRLEDVVHLFEAPDGAIIGVLTPESHANAFLNVHPQRQTAALEAAMLDTAEACLAEAQADGPRTLTVWAMADDALRIGLLRERGYTRGDWPEHQFRRDLLRHPPTASAAPDGYTIRSLGDADEIPARSYASWLAFHPDEPPEQYLGHEWYYSIQRCPMYRRDLDLVAVASDGEIAAFCTLWYDDVTRTGYFEPVGTSPAHQRKGLARAVMSEAMRRIALLGATQVTVTGYSEAAVALYASLMGPDALLCDEWVKRF